MSKVLKCDGSAGDAYLSFNAPTGLGAEYWTNFQMRIPASALTVFSTSGGYCEFYEYTTYDGVNNLNHQWYVQDPVAYSGAWAVVLNGAETDGATPTPVADSWLDVIVHTIEGTIAELKINGDVAVNPADPDVGAELNQMFLGIVSGTTDPDSVVYYRNFKMGTTEGGDDIIADDFSSETFDAWAGPTGDVSIIDDPFPPDTPATGAPVRILVAFDDDTLTETPDFTDLADPAGYRLGSTYTISRGRQSELEKTGTGTATIVFNDSQGILDPTNTAGPFTGKLDPMKQIALELWNPVTETWSRLFRGYKTDPEDDLQMWADERGLDTVTWEAADAFDLFAALQLIPGVHGDTPSLADFPDVYYAGTPSNFPDEADVFKHVDDRIVQLLDDAGWPNTGMARVGLRNIFSGNVAVQGKVYDRSDQLLAALFDAADAEFPGVAVIFVSKEGVVTFHGRYARFYPTNPDYAINTWKVGGVAEAQADPTVAPFSGSLGFRYGKSDIINSVIALPLNANDTDVAANTVEDATSIAKYGRRPETFEDLLTSAGHLDDASPTTAQEETLRFATYYVENFKDAKARISKIGFKSRAPEHPSGSAIWDLLCGVELGDRLHINTTHTAGTASGFNEYGYVEGIHYEVKGAQAGYADVTLELDVSPASFFGTNTFGTMDPGTAGG